MNKEFYNDHEYQCNHYGIYCIECTSNGVKYIGKTRESFYRRWIYHKWELKNGIHNNKYLQNTWNKYGCENFIFYPIESFELFNTDADDEKLNQLEIQYIKQYDTYENGFNLTTGGEGVSGNTLSEDAKRKIGEKNRINMLGKTHSNETRKLMSKVHTGYIKTDEHRKHLSESLTGLKRSDEQKEKCRTANQGSKQKTAKYTEEIIENLKIDLINGMNATDASKKYGIKYNYIYSGILSDNRWVHVRPNGWDEFLNIRNKKAI